MPSIMPELFISGKSLPRGLMLVNTYSLGQAKFILESVGFNDVFPLSRSVSLARLYKVQVELL